MKIKELRNQLAQFSEADDDREVKVWLPGSTISLGAFIFEAGPHGLCMEGNVDEGSALSTLDDDDGSEPRCSNPKGHSFVYTGTQYGGDDESYHGEGRCYCEWCGADGDA